MRAVRYDGFRNGEDVVEGRWCIGGGRGYRGAVRDAVRRGVVLDQRLRARAQLPAELRAFLQAGFDGVYLVFREGLRVDVRGRREEEKEQSRERE